MKITMLRKYAMRACVVALCSAALCAVPVMAQGGGGHMMNSDQRVANLDKAVTLSADQKAQIKAIYDADMKKMMDLRNSGEDRSTLMPKMMAIRTDENAQIRAVLTDEQKPKFDAFVATQMQRGPGGPPPSGAPGGDGAAPSAPPQ